MNPITLLGASLMLLITVAGCGSSQPTSRLRTVQMRLGGKEFTLEVADNAGAREIGLMNRDSMPANHGMIFVFASEQPLSFWMRNTRIPLDVIYVAASGKIVSIHQMQPFNTRGVPSAGPAKWAIELNQGTAAALGLKPGDELDIPDGARTSAD